MKAPVLGAILAGGESRRFGRDKAAAEVAGIPMIRRAWEALAPVCSEVVVVSSRPDTPEGPWRRIDDARPDGGPLVAIESALLEAETLGLSATFVLACDLPLVDASVVERLVEAGRDRGLVAPARSGEPDFEPLCAYYPIDLLGTARRLLDDGRRSARALFEASDGLRRSGFGDVFVNVNTPEALDRAARLDGEHP